ncbi:MAG: hypothetical protein ACE5I1_24500, partial [bacterium]
ALPLQHLFDNITRLSMSKQKEILAYLQHSIQEHDSTQTKNGFLNTAIGKYIAQDADDSISIDEVRKELSTIKGSLSDEVNMQREERYWPSFFWIQTLLLNTTTL